MLQALDGRFLDDQGLALDAELLSDARIIAEAADLPNKMKKADWVVTGEGRSDFQSLYGKALVVVAKMARSRTSFI
jgi:glycerate kinase